MNKQEKRTIADALKHIHSLKGDEILDDKKAVLSCLKDEIPDVEKKTVNLLGCAMDCNVFSNIKSANSGELSKYISSIAKKMENDYGVDYSMSLDIVDAIAVFYGKSNGETEYCKQDATDSDTHTQNSQEISPVISVKPATPAPAAPYEKPAPQPPTGPVSTNVYRPKKGIAKGEFSFPYCAISTVITLLIFLLDIMIYRNAVGIPLGDSKLIVYLAGYLAIVVLVRSVIMLIKSRDYPRSEGFTVWELLLWVATMIGVIALVVTMHKCGMLVNGLVYLLIIAEFAMVVISGWVYFYAVYSWGDVDGDLSVPYFSVSGGIMLGIILLDVLAYQRLFQSEYLDELLRDGILLETFISVLALAVFVRSIILLVKSCHDPDSDKFTVGELFFWIGSMLGLGALLGFMMNSPGYINIGWLNYVIVAVDLLMVIISGWRYFHVAFGWDSYSGGLTVTFFLFCIFLIFLLGNNIFASDLIIHEGTPAIFYDFGEQIANTITMIKAAGNFIVQVFLMIIGGGFWRAESFEGLLLNGPTLNVIFYAMFGTFFAMAIVQTED